MINWGLTNNPNFCYFYIKRIENLIIMKLKTVDNSLPAREQIQYHTAITFLLTGIVMCFLSFFLNQYDINNGVLFYLGTAVTFCGAVFGLDVMIKRKVSNIEDNIINKINEDKEINTLKEND